MAEEEKDKKETGAGTEESHAEHTAADQAEHAEADATEAIGRDEAGEIGAEADRVETADAGVAGTQTDETGEPGAGTSSSQEEEDAPDLEATEGVPEKVADAEAREAEAGALAAAMVEAAEEEETAAEAGAALEAQEGAPVVEEEELVEEPALTSPASEPVDDVPGREEAEALKAREDVAGQEENPIVGPAVVGTTDDKAPGEHPVGPEHEPRPEDIAPGGQAEVRDGVLGLAAFFDHPHELMDAAAAVRDAEFKDFDAYSPFPVHGMDDAMGLSRSWLPWVTFGAGSLGFLTANAIQFGMLTFDWPMIIGGKPFAPWPSFVPIMFELTVLIGGVTTALVMFIAAGCFRKPLIIDPQITHDRFVLWIAASDPQFDDTRTRAFLQGLDPVEIRTITKGA